MSKLTLRAVRRLNLAVAVLVSVVMLGGVAGVPYVLAQATSTFQQTINPGTLAVDIVDASLVSVGSPGVTMNAVNFDFACQQSTGVFGSATEQIYVNNPDAADNGWTVSFAASSIVDVWDSAGTDFDFNDPTSSGCTDGADGDSFGGQMTVDADTNGTLAVGDCASCTTGSITLGSSAAFSEGVTDTITLMTGAAGSDDIGDWTLQDVDITQQIPGEQPAASDYTIDMVLDITAS
jgi:hypothetical protein